MREADRQITAYFDGTLTTFTLPCAPGGGVLQQKLCAAMQEIPFGETRTYGALAKPPGVSAQAIGRA